MHSRESIAERGIFVDRHVSLRRGRKRLGDDALVRRRAACTLKMNSDGVTTS
jgi:hypothetical protein